jgi:diacylglycerol kinase family enzyme
LDSQTIQNVLVLVNPISGRGRGRTAVADLEKAFQKAGIPADIITLTKAGEVTPLVQENASAYGAVVAVGGDGTVCETAATVHQTAMDIPVGVIPWGLSNCLARDLNIGPDPEKAAAIIAQGKTESKDLILFQDKAALSFVGAGLDAAVVHKVAQQRTGAISNRAYISVALGTISDRPWPVLSVKVDSRIVEGEFYQVILSGITNYARFFNLPKQDGVWAYLYKGNGPTSAIRTLLKAGFNRDLAKAADLKMPIESSIQIAASGKDAWFQFDGESGGPLPVTCHVKKQAVRFIIP